MSKLLRKSNLVYAFKNGIEKNSNFRTSSAIITDLTIPKIIAKDYVVLSRNSGNLTINTDLVYTKKRYHEFCKHIAELENNIITCYDHKFNNLYYNSRKQDFDKDIQDVILKVEAYFLKNKKYESDDFFIKNISIYFEKKIY